MKFRGSVGITGAIVVAILFTAAKVFPFGFTEGERDVVNLQTFVLSDFGDEKDQSNRIVWTARFSRFAKPTDPTKELSPPDTNACTAEYFQAKPLGIPMEIESRQKWSLGIKAQFTRRGYNWIEIYPVKTDGDIMAGGKPNPRAAGKPTVVELVGIVKSLDMWVWGGNYKYWLEFYLQDHKGFLHRLSAGDLTFVGWRNVRTKIPNYVPQAEFHVPFLKPLKVTMIKFWANPTERADQFYAYLDYMQVQADVYMQRFNGDDLANNRW